MKVHWSTDVYGKTLLEVINMATAALDAFLGDDALVRPELVLNVSPSIVARDGAGKDTLVSYGGTAGATLTIVD